MNNVVNIVPYIKVRQELEEIRKISKRLAKVREEDPELWTQMVIGIAERKEKDNGKDR